MPSPQYYHWCFTLNNYVEEDCTSIQAWAEQEAKYWIIGREVGESGTPHLQGYISLRKRRSAVYVSGKLASRAFITRAAGTARQNRVYCSKAGNFVEGGEINEGKGKFKDRDEQARQFMAAVRQGDRGMVEYADSEPGTWIFHGSNMLRNALSSYPTIERPSIRVRWIWGRPGVGKSRLAHEELKTAYVKDPRTKWWNGYLCQEDVIIDDFGPNGIDINHLLRWFDRYKCSVETKGGMVALYATNFIVTSNFEPCDVFTDAVSGVHPQLPALLRRIEVVNM
ncbi:replication associated protein [Marmot associated feces virus 5]|uniref:Replication-associated protein n=1 Tax=Marmot associated feces virus 5 TaxID=2800900 RepID=A0A7T7IJF3_9VIRU|nr:replication associated protein [Marmot associated feces virus 5]